MGRQAPEDRDAARVRQFGPVSALDARRLSEKKNVALSGGVLMVAGLIWVEGLVLASIKRHG